MHTLKEILAEPQTMYDGGVVGMVDGGDTREEALKLRQKAEQIEVPEEEPTGTSLTPYIQGAKKLVKGVAGQAVRRIPGVGLIDPSPVADATIPGFMTKILEEKRNKAFEDLAGEQRGNPEVAMLELQKAIGGGVLGNIAEHVGDLTHRMSEKFDQVKGSPTSVASKIKSTLKTLRSDYGFEKEYLENIKNNAEFHNIPVEELLNKGNEKLAEYANEHRKLKVYNEPQKWARDAAVAIGEKNWNKAITELEKLEDLIKNPDAYDEAVSKFDEDFDASPVADATIPGFEDELIKQAIKNSDFYHGTTATKLEGGKFKASEEGVLGKAVYLTPDTEYAAYYAEGEGGNIHPVKINVKKPLIVRDKGPGVEVDILHALGVPFDEALDLFNKKGDLTEELQPRATEQGYDSIFLVDDKTNKIIEAAIFDPDNVVSKFKPMYDGGLVQASAKTMYDGGLV